MKSFVEKYQFWLKCWGICFGILALVFSFYLISFYIGNHDFPFMRYGTAIDSGVWEGRLTQFALPAVLFGGQVLPIAGALLGFLLFSGGTICLAKWYGMPEKYGYVVLFSLLIILHPFICSQLYYVHTVVSVLSWHLFGIIGCMFAWKFAEKLKVRWLLAAIGCLWFALAGYAPVLELILTVSVGKFLIDVFSSKVNFRQLLRRYFIYGGVLLFSLICYVLTIRFLKVTGILISGMYNVQILNLKDVFNVLFGYWYEPFRNFVLLMPYHSWFVCTGALLLVIIFLITSFYQKKIVWGFVGIASVIVAAFALVFVSPYGIFRTIRVHAMSVPYVLAIVFAIITIYSRKWWRNVSFMVTFLLVCGYIHTDLLTEKIWYLGTVQDERIVDRVRAELLPQLKEGKHYRLSSVGSFYGRQKFAGIDKISAEDREVYREYYGYGMYLYRFFSSGLFLYEAENPIWGDGTYFGNYLWYLIIGENVSYGDKISAGLFSRKFGNDKRNLVEAADKLCAYPCKHFYYIGEKDILLMVSDDEMSRLVLKWNIENERNY